MKSKIYAVVFLLAACFGALAQSSPYSNNIFTPQVFIATGQTGAPIQLNGLSASTSTVGSSYTAGNITVTGTSLTIATFSVKGSSDNGANYYLLPIYAVASPTSTPATTITVTGNGLYQVNLAGMTHVEFVTSGTFNATNLTITLTATPNGTLARGGNGGSTGGGITGCVGYLFGGGSTYACNPNVPYSSLSGVAPLWNQPTTGNAATASALGAISALPNGTTATTQAVGDSSQKVATDAFVLANSSIGGVTDFSLGAWPSWMFPTVSNPTTTPSLAVAVGPIPNAALAYPFVNVNGINCPLGSPCTIAAGGTGTVNNFLTGAWPSWMTPTVSNPTTTPSLAVTVSAIPNSALANSVVTLNSTSCALGSSCIISSTAQHIAGESIFLNMLPQYISGSTVHDISGNSNNGTMCASAPVFVITGLGFSGSNCIALPAAINSARTYEFAINIPSFSIGSAFANFLSPNTTSSPAPAILEGVSTNVANGFIGSPGASLFIYSTNATPTAPKVYMSAGNHTLIVTLGTNCSTDKDHVYYDGTEINPYWAQGCSAGLMTSGNYDIGASVAGGAYVASFTGTVYEFLASNTELTPNQVAQENAAMVSDIQQRGAGNITYPWTNQGPVYFAYGDSLTFCLASTGGYCWVTDNSGFAPYTPVPTFTNNLGNAGKTSYAINYSNVGFYNSNCATNTGPGIATVFDGTNDFASSPASTALNTAQTIASQVRGLVTAGCTVFVGTMISRGNGEGPTANGLSWNANQQQLDAIIRQNWKQWGASGILDFAADPNLGCAACNTNATYYQTDFTHLTNTGYALMSAVKANSWNYFFGYKESNPNILPIPIVYQTTGAFSSNYSYAGGPNWVMLLPTALPSSNPISSIQMQFVSAPSGSSPITMTLATGSGTSYTVVPGTAFTITPAATTAVQTFVAGTGFTGAPTPTAGQFLAMQATTPMPGYGNQGNGGGLCYLTGQSTLPSGAQSYACLAGWGMSLTVTQSTTISYNYAMQAGDGFVEYVGTAAETMTLPSCVGQSGATYKISNQTSNIITVKTLNSTQPMNGIDYSTTGLALSGTLNTFYDLPNVLGATSGCHWDH